MTKNEKLKNKLFKYFVGASYVFEYISIGISNNEIPAPSRLQQTNFQVFF